MKELRLADVSTIEAGRAFLPGFVEGFNERFAVRAAKPDDLHRKLRYRRQPDQRYPVPPRAALRRCAANPVVRPEADHPGAQRGIGRPRRSVCRTVRLPGSTA